MTTTYSKPLSASVFVYFLLTGCSLESAQPHPMTTRERLTANPTSFSVSPESVTAALTVRVLDGQRWRDYGSVLGLGRGTIQLGADRGGALEVKELSLSFSDVAVHWPQAASASGFALTQLRVHSRSPALSAAANWSEDGQRCDAVANAELVLEWGMMTETRVAVPLAPQRLEAMAARMGVSKNPAEELNLDLSIIAPGTFWSWAGMIEFADFTLAARGQTSGWKGHVE
jgi:hypothetical protein